jgi:uncharacterized protein
MASAFHPVPHRLRCVDFIGICALRVRRMLRIALGLIFWTLAMGIPSLRAQDAQGHPIGSPSQTPPVAWSDDGRTTIVPRTNTPAAKDIGEGPSPADAWWKLGRMYADRGDHARAFPIFSDLVDSYRTGSGRVPAGIAANSHVALGVYYLKGIPGTLPADSDFGYGLLEYAASYFGDPNAQYELGRLLLDGPRKNVIQAARWLQAAAKKSHRPAQALLGDILFRGDGISRQAGRGLFWLMLANDGGDPPEAWIKDRYDSALAQATEGERVLAYKHLESWLRDQRQ